MESMVQRWRQKLNSGHSTVGEEKEKVSTVSHLPPPLPPKIQQTVQNQVHVMKRSVQKNKKGLHSHQKLPSSKKLVTPNKRKNKISKNQAIDKACEQILEIVKVPQSEKVMQNKIKFILEDIWTKSTQVSQALSPRNIISPPATIQIDTSIMRQSTVSTGTAKKQQRLYQDLEKKYFDCEKERQFLKNKIDSIIKKYEYTDKQIQKYQKMQRLIQNCIQREQSTRQQNKRLRSQLQIMQLKQIEQQKMFDKQVNIIRQLVQQMKLNLPIHQNHNNTKFGR